MASVVKIKVDRSGRQPRNPTQLEDDMKNKQRKKYYKEAVGGEIENALYLHGPEANLQYRNLTFPVTGFSFSVSVTISLQSHSYFNKVCCCFVTKSHLTLFGTPWTVTH